MTEHMSIKRKVRSIDRKSTFDSIIEDSRLDDKEKVLMQMYYIQGKSLDYIADTLGYSVSGIIKMHKRALKKIENLI